MFMSIYVFLKLCFLIKNNMTTFWLSIPLATFAFKRISQEILSADQVGTKSDSFNVPIGLRAVNTSAIAAKENDFSGNVDDRLLKFIHS